jgi:hypothetical protein
MDTKRHPEATLVCNDGDRVKDAVNNARANSNTSSVMLWIQSSVSPIRIELKNDVPMLIPRPTNAVTNPITNEMTHRITSSRLYA